MGLEVPLGSGCLRELCRGQDRGAGAHRGWDLAGGLSVCPVCPLQAPTESKEERIVSKVLMIS